MRLIGCVETLFEIVRTLFTSHVLIGYEDITYPMDEGGLGVSDLLTINRAF